MKVLRNKHRTLFLMVFTVGLAFILPAMALGQGRGRGRGEEKKFYKFVNGHDARDGRWDGRGPRFGRRTPRSYVIYQQRPYYSYRSGTYGYPQTYYGSQYYTYGSSQPYYTNRSLTAIHSRTSRTGTLTPGPTRLIVTTNTDTANGSDAMGSVWEFACDSFREPSR